MALRLPLGEVTVLLGPATARRDVMARLDDDSGRCASGDVLNVLRLAVPSGHGLAARLAVLTAAGGSRASIVLVDRLTDGLTTADRRALLARLPALATGRAVLVDDEDPVAALAVADAALRVDPAGGLVPVAVRDPDYLAS